MGHRSPPDARVAQEGEALPLEDEIPWGGFALRLSAADVPRLHALLSAIPHEQVVAMRRRMAAAWPALLYRHAEPYIPRQLEQPDAADTFLRVLRKRVSAP